MGWGHSRAQGLGHTTESGTVLWAGKSPAAVSISPHCPQGLALPTGSTDPALAHLPTGAGYFWMVTAGILWGRGSP